MIQLNITLQRVEYGEYVLENKGSFAHSKQTKYPGQTKKKGHRQGTANLKVSYVRGHFLKINISILELTANVPVLFLFYFKIWKIHWNIIF